MDWLMKVVAAILTAPPSVTHLDPHDGHPDYVMPADPFAYVYMVLALVAGLVFWAIVLRDRRKRSLE
jgi:hypothetical protein